MREAINELPGVRPRDVDAAVLRHHSASHGPDDHVARCASAWRRSHRRSTSPPARGPGPSTSIARCAKAGPTPQSTGWSRAANSSIRRCYSRTLCWSSRARAIPPCVVPRRRKSCAKANSSPCVLASRTSTRRPVSGNGRSKIRTWCWKCRRSSKSSWWQANRTCSALFRAAWKKLPASLFGLRPLRDSTKAAPVPILLIWHASREADPAHAFLRKELAAAATAIVQRG